MPAVDLKVTLGLKWSATVPAPPSGGLVEFKIGLQGWNGFLKIEYPSFSQEYPTTLAMSFVSIVTLTIPVGVDVKGSMLNGAHAPLNLNPAQSFNINDGAFGAGWTFVTSATSAPGVVYTVTENYTQDFPFASWTMNTSP